MSLDSALYSHLTTDSAITALIAMRVYPDAAPQDVAWPYVTFMAAATENGRHMTAGDGLARVTMQIDVWADSSEARRAITGALFNRLHGFRGAMGAEALGVRSVHFDGPANTHERPTDDGEIGTYRGRCDVTIWHVESVPTFT